MGTGASILNYENARTHIKVLIEGKPEDASDITNLDDARNEIKLLRKYANEIILELESTNTNQSSQSNTQRRLAIRDKKNVVNDISVADYVPIVFPKLPEKRDWLYKIVKANILFSSYHKDDIAAIVDAFERINFSKGEFIINQGDDGETFYIVEEGTLDVMISPSSSSKKHNKIGKQLKKGSYFGELSLMYNAPRSASIQATTDCSCWFVTRQTYKTILIHNKYLRNKQYKNFLKNVNVMNRPLETLMSNSEIERLISSLECEIYDKGDVIVRKGSKGDSFFIIAEGTVGVYIDDKVNTMQKGDYFGEDAILREDVRQASCIAESHVVCLSLERSDFIELIGSFEEILRRKDANEFIQSPKPTSTHMFGNYQDSLQITLQDLEFGKVLGKGAFGLVKLAIYKQPDVESQTFAVKCQSKVALIESGFKESVLNEMKLMQYVSKSPWITKIYCTLQDKYYIYFVLELLQGGEFFSYLRHHGKLSEPSAKFYAAIVIKGLSNLHELKIAYRDLKPENLVFDFKGYIKIVDLGLAKRITNGKTWTVCGTPDYLSPEVFEYC